LNNLKSKALPATDIIRIGVYEIVFLEFQNNG